MKNICLSNGVQMPLLGLGTWQITDRAIMKNVLSDAWEQGYRLIDTAAAYSNEIAIGRALTDLKLPRNDLLLSDKVWNTCRGYEQVQDACRRTLKKLKTDYLDLYLVHWPASPKLHPNWAALNAETWRGMEQLYQDGLVRAIGVCNFKAYHLLELQKSAEILPMVNQFECHPGMNQDALLKFCSAYQIHCEASSPLGNGQILKNPEIERIAGQYGRSSAQVCLRWAVQKNITVIPKTTNMERLKENRNIFDFSLTEQEMNQIDGMPYFGGLGLDPDEVTEFG